MKNLTLLLITPLLLFTPLFAYDLTDADRLLIDSFQPKIQVMVEQEIERFDTILTKLETMMPLFEADTRVYVVLDYLQQVMIALIPEEPTVIETLDLASLFGELEDIGTKQDDEDDNTEVDLQESDEEPIILSGGKPEQVSEEEVDEIDPNYDYYAQEIGEYDIVDEDEYVSAEAEEEDEFDEEFDLSDQGFEFDYEFEEDEFDLDI